MRANQVRQPTPGECRFACLEAWARRGCAFRWPFSECGHST